MRTRSGGRRIQVKRRPVAAQPDTRSAAITARPILEALALTWATELAALWSGSPLAERQSTALLASRYAERLTSENDLFTWAKGLETAILATYRQYGPAAGHLRRSGMKTLSEQISRALKQPGFSNQPPEQQAQMIAGLTRLYTLPLIDTPLPELLQQPQPVDRVLTTLLSQPLAPGYPLTWQGALQREANTLVHSLSCKTPYTPRGWR